MNHLSRLQNGLMYKTLLAIGIADLVIRFQNCLLKIALLNHGGLARLDLRVD
jgi:hypothetical protein